MPSPRPRSFQRTLSPVVLALATVHCTTPDPAPVDGSSTGDVGTSSTGPEPTTSTGTVDSTTTTTDVPATDSTTGASELPGVPVLTLTPSPIKRFDFTWDAVEGALHYELLESAAPGEPLVPLAGDLVDTSFSMVVPLHLRFDASWVLRACNEAGCTDSAPVSVATSLAEAVGYVKASNSGTDDRFGFSVALSGDGTTLALGAIHESSSSTGVNGNQNDDIAGLSGAVYVLVQDGRGGWSQQAYIKASNTGIQDRFGYGVALSTDGNTLAVGADQEGSAATGVGGAQTDNSLGSAGAAYVFVRDEAGQWSQQAYVKASNTDGGDRFGYSIALAGDGNTLAVGAIGEDGSEDSIDGNQADDTAENAGAVYVFVRAGAGAWSQQAYVKAINTDALDAFGGSVALSGNGNTLAVGAHNEDSIAQGVNGPDDNDGLEDSGAVYVLARSDAGQWSHAAYVKASNPGVDDAFGWSVDLSEDGSTLAVGAHLEDSSATGIGGDQDSNAAADSGAVYVFVRNAGGLWSQQAYVKASDTAAGDNFGQDVALSGNGDVLAVGAPFEDGGAVGVGIEPGADEVEDAGAAYVLVRSNAGAWSPRSAVKAISPGESDFLGAALALADDGRILAVAAPFEDGSTNGIGDPPDDSASAAGAVHLY